MEKSDRVLWGDSYTCPRMVLHAAKPVRHGGADGEKDGEAPCQA